MSRFRWSTLGWIFERLHLDQSMRMIIARYAYVYIIYVILSLIALSFSRQSLWMILIWIIHISYNSNIYIYIYSLRVAQNWLHRQFFVMIRRSFSDASVSARVVAGSSSFAWRVTSPVCNRRVDESCCVPSPESRVPDTFGRIIFLRHVRNMEMMAL